MVGPIGAAQSGRHLRFRHAFPRLFAGLLATLLTACGGGGDGAAPATDSNAGPVLTGQFVDSAVSGLRYSTPTLQGDTSVAGVFQYRAGETVSFYVGDILVGRAIGAATLTPFDLAGATPPQSDADVRREIIHMRNQPRPTPLEVAANIATFLQTLDEDGDPSNGIAIPGALHTLATGARLSFNKKIQVFSRTLAFRQLVSAGRAEGVWGGSRAIRDSYLALDALYAAQGLTMSAGVTAIREIDTNADGTVDSQETNTYDGNGQLVQYDQDSNADSSIDIRHTLAYDTNGTQTALSIDNFADGIVDIRFDWTYDADGNLIKLEQNANGGTMHSIFNFAHDVNGYETEQDTDSDADGTVDARFTYGYDVDGNQTLVETDSNADGAPDVRAAYAYDTDDNQTAYELDNDADGVVDHRETATFDTDGRRTMTEVDDNGDGTVDERITYHYDVDGNQTQVDDDTNADGTVDYRETHSFDVDGRRTSFEADTDGDGVVDYRKTWTYVGNQIVIAIDSNGDGITDSRFIYTTTPTHSWEGTRSYSWSSDEWPAHDPVGSFRF